MDYSKACFWSNYTPRSPYHYQESTLLPPQPKTKGFFPTESKTGIYQDTSTTKGGVFLWSYVRHNGCWVPQGSFPSAATLSPSRLGFGGSCLLCGTWPTQEERLKRFWHQFSHLDYLLDCPIAKFSLVSPLWKDHNFQPSFPCLTLKQGLAIKDRQISEECVCFDRAETEKNKNQKNLVAAQGEETSKKQKKIRGHFATMREKQGQIKRNIRKTKRISWKLTIWWQKWKWRTQWKSWNIRKIFQK